MSGPYRSVSAHTSLDRILRHEAAYFTSMAAAGPRDGWVLFHNADFPGRFDPNHAGVFRAPEGTGQAIVDEIVAFYEGRGTAPVAYVDALATPHDLIPCLLARGFVESTEYGESDLMLYVGPDVERPSTAHVEAVRTQRDREDWASIMEEDRPEPSRSRLARLYCLEVSDPRTTGYLVRVDGRPAGRCELFSSDGLGRVEAVRTLAPYQRRGLAAAVVRQAVRDSLRRGNELTYLYAEHGGEAQRLYERLGYRTVARNAMRSFRMATR